MQANMLAATLNVDLAPPLNVDGDLPDPWFSELEYFYGASNGSDDTILQSMDAGPTVDADGLELFDGVQPPPQPVAQATATATATATHTSDIARATSCPALRSSSSIMQQGQGVHATPLWGGGGAPAGPGAAAASADVLNMAQQQPLHQQVQLPWLAAAPVLAQQVQQPVIGTTGKTFT